jgi:xanthine dehydrogenase large subunit
MLAMSVFYAIRDAIGSLSKEHHPQLDAPATPERVLFAVEELQAQMGPEE